MNFPNSPNVGYFPNTILKPGHIYKQETIYKTEMTIPGLNENEYFRFWEESTFSALSSQGYAVNSDDDFTFGLLDARDKVHLFNIRNFKYNII